MSLKDLYSDKHDVLIGATDDIFAEDQRCKQGLSRQIKRNVAFANGDQNFLDQPGQTTAVDNGTNLIISPVQNSRRNMYLTNEIDPLIRTLVSYMTRAKPAIEVFPGDQSEESRRKASVCERVMTAKYDLDNEYYNTKMSAFWALTAGTVFRKDFWDNGSGSWYSTPQFDEVGNEIIDPNTGKVATREYRGGMNNVAILTPLSISFDWSFTDFEMFPWIQENYLMPVEWARKAFDIQAPGYTGKAKDINANKEIGNSLTILEELKYSITNNARYNQKTSTVDKVLIKELYVQPNDDYPQGRLIIIAGNVIVYDGPSPYYMAFERKMWHPYSYFQYEPYIGRFLGKSLVEELVPVQLRLNEINGAILENANTTGKVSILAAENQLKRGVISGAGDQIYTYKHIPGVPPPAKWAGTPLPAQFFNERQTLIDYMVRRAGTNFVMQGEPPKGVTAASAIEQLLDNASGQLSDMQYSFQKYHEQGFTKKMRLIRSFNKLPDVDLINYIRMNDRDALNDDVSNFVGEDFGDGNVLRIEDGSMVPKSEKIKKDLYKEFAQGGILGPALQEDSPRGTRLRKELMKKFGETGFEIEESVDVEKAEWENILIKKLQAPHFEPYDNHAIHISILLEMLKSPKFIERASPEVKMLAQKHLEQHQLAQQQEQQQQMQEQMNMQLQQQMLASGVVPQVAEEAPAEAPPVEGQVLQ